MNVELSEVKDFLQIEGGIKDFLYFHYTLGDMKVTKFPIRVNAFSVGVCMKGWIDVSMGIQRVTLNACELIVIFPMQIMQVHKVSEDFEFQAISISTDFMESMQVDASKIFSFYFYIEENPILRIDDPEAWRLMLSFYSNLNSLGEFSFASYYKEVIQHSVFAFLYGLGSAYKHKIPQNGKQSIQDKNSLLKRFLSLLQDNFKTQRTIGFYADKLCVTPKYLTTYIKKTSNKTAGELIHEIVILEAKVLLRVLGSSVQGVSDELHFPDQSTFGKFFKKYVGVSPKEYKRDYRSY